MGIFGDINNLLKPQFSTSSSQPSLTYNRFDYYSGSQITVWFGDIMLDDINSIQWSRTQNKKPIYGYASQQFDAVAKGVVIIQGSLVINYRQAGYLSLVMDSIARLYDSTANKKVWPEVRKVIGAHLKNGTFGPKTIQEIQDLANSPNFLELSKTYEDIIWGDIETQTVQDGLSAVANGESYSTASNIVPADVYQHNLMSKGFNILVTYGNNTLNDKRRLSDYLQSTVKSLNGVHLVGDSQVIQVGGQPVLEQYDFIARGTDEQLSSLR